MRAAAVKFGVDESTVRLWTERAGDERLDRVDFTSRLSAPTRTLRVSADVEALILDIRRELRDQSALGEYGPIAISAELLRRKCSVLPSLTTIKRVLRRRGALDGNRRIRRRSPPPGWYLPDVSQRKADIDSFDVIEDLNAAPHAL
jgi:hypothetical protein